MAKRPGAGGVIVLAISLGLVTAYLIWASFRSMNEAKDSENVVLATVDINPHTPITRDMIELTPYPKKLIAENAVTNITQAEGKVSQRFINKKSQIRAADLVQEGQGQTLAIEVPKGKRAIAVVAGEVTAVGNSIKPGDHVDILATYTDPRTRQELTKMLLQDVLVLAVNQGQTDPNTKVGASTSMTLTVKPEETELIAAAERSGALKFSLRPVGDHSINPSAGVSPKDFAASMVPEIQPTVVRVVTNEPNSTPVVILQPAPQRPHEITVLSGSTEKIVIP